MNKMKLFLIHQERESHRRWGWNSMNWSIRVLRCRRVGGKFEIKGAQRPDLRKFIHRGRSKLTEERRDTKRERGGNRPWNGRWSRCALPYAKHWPPWSDCIRYIFEGRARNWLEDPRLLLPCPLPFPFSCASGPIRLFPVEYPTKWGQVLRRICGIDATHLSAGGWYIHARKLWIRKAEDRLTGVYSHDIGREEEGFRNICSISERKRGKQLNDKSNDARTAIRVVVVVLLLLLLLLIDASYLELGGKLFLRSLD